MKMGLSSAAVALTGTVKAVAASLSARTQEEMDSIQKEIDALPNNVFKDFVHGSYAAEDKSKMADSVCDTMYAQYPILRRYDDAFRKVAREMRETEVCDTPAIWYVYNMGIVVKTRKALFSIDLCHRLAPTIADELDFAVISHNHIDHYTRAFYRAMDGRHKTVFQNFECNYGAALNKGSLGGFSHSECKYDIGDVTIHTYVSDHNPILRKFVMPVEVHIGDYTILHSGDTHNVQDLHPVRTPDMWIHHAWCWGNYYKREEWANSETVRGIRAFSPRLAVVAHHQELSHSKPGRRSFDAAQNRKTAAEEAGVCALAPFWGDRLA